MLTIRNKCTVIPEYPEIIISYLNIQNQLTEISAHLEFELSRHITKVNQLCQDIFYNNLNYKILAPPLRHGAQWGEFQYLNLSNSL